MRVYFAVDRWISATMIFYFVLRSSSASA